jgi:stage V sporulation protein SpoVS
VRLVPLKVNANPFYVAGAEAGAVTRASQASVINVGAGGGSVPTFVVG